MGAFRNMTIHLGGIVTRKVARELYDWIDAMSVWADNMSSPSGASPDVSATMDPTGGLRTSGSTAFNTLVEPNISFPEWIVVTNTRKLTHQDTLTSLLDGTWLNPLKATGGNGEIRHFFTPCPGSTGGTFTVRAKMPQGVANNTMKLIVYTAGLVVLFSTVVTVTANAQNFSLVATGLAPNTSYFVAIQTNDSAQQCNPIISSATFTPNGGTGTFAFSADTQAPAFVRIGLSQAMATANQMTGWSSGVFPFTNPFADYVVQTNATSVAYEAYNNAGDGICWLLYAGLPLKQGITIANGAVNIEDVALPVITPPIDIALAARMQAFTVRAGGGSGPQTNLTFGQSAMCVPRAIYVPQGASFALGQNNADSCAIYSGDSVSAGSLSVSPGFQAFALGMRDWYQGEIIIDSYISQALFNYIAAPGTLNDPAKQKAYALWLSRRNPTDIIIDLGINDKVGNQWTAAQFQLGLQGVVNNLLAFNEHGRIWLKSPCITTVEGANGLGSTMTDYRNAIAAVVTATNDPRCIFIDGLGALFHIAGDLVDTVHPNGVGQAKDREALLTIFAANVAA